MKLWLISQSVNSGYDTYDSAVVAAMTEEEAKVISPSEFYKWLNGSWYFETISGFLPSENGSWADPKDVSVELLGEALETTEAGVICASFNAG